MTLRLLAIVAVSFVTTASITIYIVPNITSICAGVITKNTCKLGINLASIPLPVIIARPTTRNGDDILKESDMEIFELLLT